jgi:hypothetical protein
MLGSNDKMPLPVSPPVSGHFCHAEQKFIPT